MIQVRTGLDSRLLVNKKFFIYFKTDLAYKGSTDIRYVTRYSKKAGPNFRYQKLFVL